MDKPSKKEEQFTRDLLKSAGLSTPSEGFSNRLMQTIVSRQVAKNVYQPLLSKKAWGVLVILLMIVVIAIFVLPLNQESLLDKLGMTSNFNFSFPEFKLSKTFTYAIGFLALFLVQIPFLKHYFGKPH